MLSALVRKIVGTKNDRELKRLWPIVDEINGLEADVAALPDDRLQARTAEFREKLSQGADLDDILPAAFATAREASKRVLGMRPFDVQLLGGMVLHQGKIAEMKTGEGKTLVATLPTYLNALSGRGVHVVTVNDYLARRDAEWMGRLYTFLGLSVGTVVHGMDDAARKVSYAADITYGQNNEFGFDYLRDNMKFSLDEYVQRELNFAIVDEVDSILVDEARTPLIISGPAEQSVDTYRVIDKVIPKLVKEEHFTVDEKTKSVVLTEEGVQRVENLLGIDNLYDPGQIETLHHVSQSLRAHTLFQRDVEYVVKDGEVIIVDEFTGRLMPGRRWSDGLHQAVEAKEGVKIERENQTLATITFQNYFRMYKKLAGMTGTADTEAVEFKKIYNLDVVVMPTHRDMVRIDHPDVVYKTEKEKFEAVVEEIADCHQRGQPVLVGTISIEKSEALSKLLKREGIRHHVLNAKNHEREAEIVAQAGRHEAVTISTNMAGRGTDIVLGGNPEGLAMAQFGERQPENPDYVAALAAFREQCAGEREKVVEAGGLHILGTERHESRRIDNQLRGRAGRQGDPGSSRFYLSLEDDLLRIFGADRIQGLMERLGMEDGVPIEHRMITRAIANAQQKVEGHNFDIRKHLLEYDDVMNKQREVIYHRRREALGGESLREDIVEMIGDLSESIVNVAAQAQADSDAAVDWSGLGVAVAEQFHFTLELPEGEPDQLKPEDLQAAVLEQATRVYEAREQTFGEPIMRHLEKVVVLQTIDQLWKDHLLSMDRLKEGIGLRGYAQVNPLQAYQKEGFSMFEDMMQRIESETIKRVFTVQLVREEDVERMEERRQPQPMTLSHGAVTEAPPPSSAQASGDAPKIGRNDPCPCGSGKKYKKCHGA